MISTSEHLLIAGRKNIHSFETRTGMAPPDMGKGGESYDFA